MAVKELILLFIGSALVNNFLLARFLGICSFLGVTSQLRAAVSMGVAVTGVMFGASTVSWLLYAYVLDPLGLQYLQYVVFILVIASMVQALEQVIKARMPGLYRAFGIYLPLITTNCAILGVALLVVQNEYNLLSSIVFALGGGAGFTLAMAMMAGLREEFRPREIPHAFRGTGIGLVTAGIMSLAFLAFSGMIPM